ncbi:MAG: lipopolysaccharide heptosyltransferase family protein [Rhodospirillales bacterium]|nr:lipopolysaccharide heptosyltransferase family protein [Alphaproteobacteria bacterium]MBL6928727.1 lipopolysaccharide heptosyltransferase family protein [Rhodospirillales bacterium]
MARLARLADAFHRLKRRIGSRSGTPSGILIVSSGGLGDTVLFALVLPRLAAMAKDGENITVLLRSDGAKTAFLFDPKIEVLSVDFARLHRDTAYRWQQFDQLYRRNFRIALSADFLRHPHLDEALLVAAAAEQTLGMEARPWPKYDRQLQANRRYFDHLFDSGPVHVDKVVRWARFADWATGETAPAPKVGLLAERLPEADGRDGDFVVIQPFSAVTDKQPSADVFGRIIEAIPDHVTKLITGAPGDLDKNPDFASLLNRANVRFDDSRLEPLCGKLRRARLVVSVDTAVMHMAVVAGAPTICLASAAYVGEIVPYADEIMPGNVSFHFHDMPCRGCLGNCTQPREAGRFACVERLEIDPVLDKIRSVFPDSDREIR